MNLLSLDALVLQREEQKLAEDQAIAARRATDDMIFKVLGIDLDSEGTVNQPVSGNKRVVVTTSMSREIKKADYAEFLRIRPLMPPNVVAAFRDVPPEVNVRLYKDLATTDPYSYGILAKIVTAKPNRPSMKIEDFTPTPEGQQ